MACACSQVEWLQLNLLLQFQTLYKNEEDQWRGSSSFAREDLPLLIKVADQVHSYLYEQSEQNGNNGSSEDISF